MLRQAIFIAALCLAQHVYAATREGCKDYSAIQVQINTFSPDNSKGGPNLRMLFPPDGPPNNACGEEYGACIQNYQYNRSTQVFSFTENQLDYDRDVVFTLPTKDGAGADPYTMCTIRLRFQTDLKNSFEQSGPPTYDDFEYLTSEECNEIFPDLKVEKGAPELLYQDDNANHYKVPLNIWFDWGDATGLPSDFPPNPSTERLWCMESVEGYMNSEDVLATLGQGNNSSATTDGGAADAPSSGGSVVAVSMKIVVVGLMSMMLVLF